MKSTFTKAERLCSQTAIDRLFADKSVAYTLYPFRVIVRAEALSEDDAVVLPRLLISVSKRRFHHAVDRNRTKRLIREGWRRAKQPLGAFAAERRLSVDVALVWMSSDLMPQDVVTRRTADVVARLIRELRSLPPRPAADKAAAPSSSPQEEPVTPQGAES